jgi:hypothetical protein
VVMIDEVVEGDGSNTGVAVTDCCSQVVIPFNGGHPVITKPCRSSTGVYMLTCPRWKIYRSLGADVRIKRYYFHYQVFECICRFSAFFFAGFGILVSLSPHQ